MVKRLEPWKKGDSITAKRLNKMQSRLPGNITGGRGISVANVGKDTVISLSGNNPRSFQDEFWAEIRDYTAVSGDKNQWTYGFVQRVVKYSAEDGYYMDSPADSDTTLSGTSNDLTTCAINLNELNNDNSGVESNGINVDTLNEGLSIQPIAVGSVVRMFREPIAGLDPDAEGEREYVWAFVATNLIDGTCV